MPTHLAQRTLARACERLTETVQTGLRTGPPFPVITSLRPPTTSPARTVPQLAPGCWHYRMEGFCLGVGRSAPVRHARYAVAQVAGRSDLVRMLAALADYPEVDQQKGQSLLWGIRAGSSINHMDRELRALAERLCPGFTVRSLARDAAARLLRQSVLSLISRCERLLPSETVSLLRSVREVSQRISSSLPYQELERLALAPPPPDVATSLEDQWMLSPAGYFIKLSPRGYTEADAYVRVPRRTDPYVVRDDRGRVSEFGLSHGTRAMCHYQERPESIPVPGLGNVPGWSMSAVELLSQDGRFELASPGWIPRDWGQLAGANPADCPEVAPLVASLSKVFHDQSNATAMSSRVVDAFAFKRQLEAVRHFSAAGVESAVHTPMWEWDPLPDGYPNRPGLPLQVEHITLHDTGNACGGTDARWHGRYMRSEDAQQRKVSWHFTVDDKGILHHVPLNERANHSGRGNSSSIGIEICMNLGIDRARAEYNAAKLVAQLLRQYNLPVDRLTTHRHWTGKNCPMLLLSRWESFVNDVRMLLAVDGHDGALADLEEGWEDMLLDEDGREEEFRPQYLIGLPGDVRQQRLGFRLPAVTSGPPAPPPPRILREEDLPEGFSCGYGR